MRTLVPWTGATLVLLALLPGVCMGAEGETISCQSVVLLPLPWRDSADTWGFVVALGASALTFVLLWKLLHRPRKSDS